MWSSWRRFSASIAAHSSGSNFSTVSFDENMLLRGVEVREGLTVRFYHRHPGAAARAPASRRPVPSLLCVSSHSLVAGDRHALDQYRSALARAAANHVVT